MVTPKDLLVACCETDLRESYEISSNRPSNVNGTGTQPTTMSSLSPLFSITQLWTIRGSQSLELVPRIQCFSIMSDVV